ncbi:PAS domain S-box protein [Aquimarina sp. TRL1]|uniref:PAS domain-containing sensor histidine kinase n=1 Tax=Aquimarina sp. (strain TRL1) TaxID=2736252 RepID=UPI001588A4CB|nr:ATP-binding protein [Aquimarina sp. TRL1]QKX07541.1 PAS domain S-box protein [Aquimarina sp. TRL1]
MIIEENSEIFKILSDAISEGIIVVNEERIIVATNTCSDDMFGYESRELVGKHLNILIPERYHIEHKQHVSNFMMNSGKRQMGRGRDLFGCRKDGKQFPVEVGLTPFHIGEKHYVMALIIDISIRKEQERLILELNDKLEQRINERTEELGKTVSELRDEVKKRKEAENKIKESLRKERELNELKTKFLSLVSHEFKTPLSGILTSATLAGKYVKTEQQEKREKHLNTIKSKIRYLDGILNDFLSIERIDSGKVNYKFTSFPLSKVVNEVLYGANMLLKSGQKITYPENIEEYIVEFDEKILELVLSNLIHNAVKYSPEDTTIDLVVRKEGKMLEFIVRDEGIGIPEKEQKFIFNRYFRAENALLNQGTGIGLNIVKSHLESLGGSISYISEENKGSTFIVQIPQ